MRIRCAMLATLIGVTAEMASADQLGSVDMSYVGGGKLISAFDYTAYGQDHRLLAGEMMHRVDGSAGLGEYIATDATGHLSTFCIELQQSTSTQFRPSLSRTSARFDVVSLTGTGPGSTGFTDATVQRIHAVLRASIDLGYIDNQLQLADAATANQAAAVQALVWEAIWEADGVSMDLAGGDSLVEDFGSNVGVSNAATDIANAANGFLDGSREFASFQINGLVALTNARERDHLAVAVVPLPTPALAGLSLIGCILIVRRLRRR